MFRVLYLKIKNVPRSNPDKLFSRAFVTDRAGFLLYISTDIRIKELICKLNYILVYTYTSYIFIHSI